MTKAKAIDLPPDEVLEAMARTLLNHKYGDDAWTTATTLFHAVSVKEMQATLQCPAFLTWLEGVRGNVLPELPSDMRLHSLGQNNKGKWYCGIRNVDGIYSINEALTPREALINAIAQIERGT